MPINQGLVVNMRNRTFAIFSSVHLDKVDFSQILQTSAETVSRSLDGSKVFIKWDRGEPSFLANIPDIEMHSYEEMLDILRNHPEWAKPLVSD